MSTMFMICMLFFSTMVLMAPLQISAAHPPLKQGFYWKLCPSAENIVWSVVNQELRKDPTIAAGLIRLYFHDCFIRGCDASVLLDSTASKNKTEKKSPANQSIRGFEVIDKAKARLEAKCPGIVSCADTLAFAARDSTYKSGGIYYNLPSGRRDGTISLESEVATNLPPPFLDVAPMLKLFTNKGMSVKEMTALSGAHSIGTAQCGTISSRLYSFNTSHPQDPSLDSNYAKFLKRKCPKNAAAGEVVLDVVTPDRLDNQYYKNLKKNMGVLTTDQVLANNPLTSKIVKNYIDNPDVWVTDFAAAMVHLGDIDVLTGTEGEIRNKCGVIN